MKIRAAVLSAFDEPLEVQELELAEPGPREALIRLAWSGVCHSDQNAMNGKAPTPMPAVLGHEGGGVVASGGGLLLADEDGGVGDDTVEDGGVAEVDKGVEGEIVGKEMAKFFAVIGAVEFVGGDEGEDAVWLEQGGGAFVEIDEEIGGAGVGGVAFSLDEGFLILDEFLADVGRIGDDDVEAALLEDITEEEMPEEVGALGFAGGLLKLLVDVLEVKKRRFEGAQGFC